MNNYKIIDLFEEVRRAGITVPEGHVKLHIQPKRSGEMGVFLLKGESGVLQVQPYGYNNSREAFGIYVSLVSFVEDYIREKDL